MKNNMAFTLTNNDEMFFFYFYRRFLSTDHRKNKKDYFFGRVEKDYALPHLSGEKIYDMVLEYSGIVFDFESNKQKFYSFGLTHNWIKQSIL